MIILDACLIIAFGNAGQLHLIDELKTDRVCVGGRARMEVQGDPANAAMEASIAAGRLSVVSVDLSSTSEQTALQAFDSRPAFRGRGEAEVLAIASVRGYTVASDDRAVRTTVRDAWGQQRLAGTADFIVWAVREGRVSLDDAEAALQTIDSGVQLLRLLAARGSSLRDLV